MKYIITILCLIFLFALVLVLTNDRMIAVLITGVAVVLILGTQADYHL